MKVLLVHLSDIHIRDSDDTILSRAKKISSAVRDREPNVAACFIVISGDTAFSGLDEQYSDAVGFLAEIADELTSYFRTGAEVRFVVVPGNHDCDFSAATSVRDQLLNGVEDDPSQASNEDIVELCTVVQNNYFDYMRLLSDDCLDQCDRLYYEYGFAVGNYNLLFRCYNTAWMSRLHEKQGSLVFPLDKAGGKRDGFDLTVSVLHHPYNWLESQNARALKKHVEETSDVILTGHEHDQTQQIRSGAGGERNQYIEGGVLQESWDHSTSTFNALVLDLDAQRQKFLHLAWDGEMYRPVLGSDEAWEDLQVNRLLARRDFEVSPAFEGYLEDYGVALSHPEKGDVRLSQVFVYPALRQTTSKEDALKLVEGGDTLEHLTAVRKAMILGADESGKTALAKGLFRDLHEAGFVPVLVDGAKLSLRTDDRLYREFYRLFEEQYSPRFLEKYKQLGRAQRVLIFDNFHRLNPRHPVARRKFMRLLDDFADRYVLIANDQVQKFGDLFAIEGVGDPLSDLPRYDIEEFGHEARDELFDKWYSLSEDPAQGVAELSRKINEAHSILNTILGKSFVPAYPVFVFSVLQALEAGRSVDPNANTYGYFYELFIKTSLAKISDLYVDYDVRMAYLSFLAYRMFVERLAEPSIGELERIHEEYQRVYHLAISFDRMLSDLERAGILEEVAEGYRAFKYKYMYYYFVANHLKEHISEEDARGHISEMCWSIDAEENANILLFLAHLIKDPYTIGEMLGKARSLFTDFAPAEFGDDVLFFGSKAKDEEVRFSEEEAATFRKEVLRKADKLEREESGAENGPAAPGPSDQDTREEFEPEVAMKTIQILGQMLKNFPGSLRGDQKSALTEECYGLGLRLLGAVFLAVRESGDMLVDILVEHFKENEPVDQETTAHLVERAKLFVHRIAQAAAYTIVKRIADSVGSSALTETYRRVLEKNPTDAARLIDAVIKLNYEADFPLREITDLGERLKDSNPFAMFLLRQMVVTHLYMFELGYQKKQSACAALGISYKALKVTDPRFRKLGQRSETLPQNPENAPAIE